MKSYTDLEQSKKLAEILPIESADMALCSKIQPLMTDYISAKKKFSNAGEIPIDPCWSLAALLNYLREIDLFPQIDADECNVTMSINYYNEEETRLLVPIHTIKVKAESFVDACYEMIVKLHELKML